MHIHLHLIFMPKDLENIILTMCLLGSLIKYSFQGLIFNFLNSSRFSNSVSSFTISIRKLMLKIFKKFPIDKIHKKRSFP